MQPPDQPRRAACDNPVPAADQADASAGHLPRATLLEQTSRSWPVPAADLAAAPWTQTARGAKAIISDWKSASRPSTLSTAAVCCRHVWNRGVRAQRSPSLTMSDPIQASSSGSAGIEQRLSASLLAQYMALCKPRVLQLIVFCAFIGMVLAIPGVPSAEDWLKIVLASGGIWLVAAAAAAFNCLVEKSIDAKMRRTAWRPTARGELSEIGRAHV